MPYGNNIFDFENLPNFTVQEREMNVKLIELFANWFGLIASSGNWGEEYSEWLVSDGFYPCYTQQKVKILFIGRESLEMASKSYIHDTFHSFRNNSLRGTDAKPISACSVERKMFKIAYGLNNSYIPWQEIPHTRTMYETFGSEKGLSFAVMNLSKVSNESPEGNFNKSNMEQIEKFLEVSSQLPANFAEEQIKILNPDIIIAMNMSEKYNYLGSISPVTTSPNSVHLYEMELNDTKIPVLDTYHFAATKGEDSEFYTPIVEHLVAWRASNA